VPADVVDLRQVRGLALAKAKSTRFRHIAGDTYLVPSQTTAGGGYIVDAAKAACSCPDYEERGVRCKHLWAVAYFRQELAEPDAELPVPTPVRPTYPQDWPAYNRAQCEEKERAQILLKALCDGIAQPPQKMGRPRLPLRDAVYCATMKVYGTMSGRRSTTDLQACEENGFVAHAPSYNSLFRTVERPELAPLLKILIEQAALPLRAVEETFAVDGTGFATSTYARWFDHKYGEEKKIQRWVKAHAMVGTYTNIVTSVEVTDGFANDSPMFVPLLERTAASGFLVRDVCADKAYLSHENLAAVERVGGVPYIPLKTNSGPSGSAAWERLYHLYALHREDFLKHYHQRSNVESVFSAIKRKFGGAVRSKLLPAQLNEVLLKCLCHNLSMLVHSIHELGIDPVFWNERAARVEAP